MSVQAVHKLDFEFQLIDSYLQPLCTGRWLVAHLVKQGDFDGVRTSAALGAFSTMMQQQSV